MTHKQVHTTSSQSEAASHAAHITADNVWDARQVEWRQPDEWRKPEWINVG